MTDELRFTEKTNGLVLLLIGLVGVFATATLFRPRAPSPFSEGSGFGTGYGSDSIMVGAEPKPGAAR
jgi:hypothetical protein